MRTFEFTNILAAIIILTIVGSFAFILKGDLTVIPEIFLFSLLIIGIAIFSKKLTAYLLDADVEHEFWHLSRFGFEPTSHFKKEIPAGIIFPLVFSLLSLGLIKISSLLTYETRALKQRAAKRFGFYSYTEMTDWHTGIIGGAGIIGVLILATVAYLLPLDLEYLAKMATYYSFWNLLPISKLDGTQIFFGSRVLYVILASITLIFTAYAIIL